MLKDIQFSIPLWPGLSPEEIERDVYPFLEECKDVISDLYFTCRLPPFQNDAMGGVIVPEEVATVTRNAMIVADRFGLHASPTFNNITVSPSFANYQTFVKHFRPLYDEGIRIVTIPNTAWLRFGLKQEFPELFVKNTILNRVQTASEVAVLFQDGFDYINLDRTLMRDERTLKEVHAAKLAMERKLGRKLYISLLYNEMCEGNCPVHQDHYTYNLRRAEKDKAYFASEMFDISPCKIKDENSILWALKAASIPSFYSTLDNLSNYVDVFKMHGRESKHTFYQTLKIVRQFVRREMIDDPYRQALSVLPELDRKIWLKTIRTCRFNCWKCTVCEDTVAKIKENQQHA
ncbi:hypothetical protein [Ralstonia phage RP31]|uniref:Peptidase n=1 Tax=Ralstonia phage RP31 TaxID=1923890 RepID=A0A1L7N1P0_9CAUD|nr:hypothetical protein [Ralstonia phage RP31]